jgi:nucleoside diphosphate kinase
MDAPMKNLSLLILSGCLVIIGCSSTNTVTMSVQQPAVVSIPSTMKNVGVIDRSLTKDEGGVLQRIDQVMSVKGSELDKKGALAGINGLVEELSKNNRLQSVKKLDVEQLENPAYGVLPAPLAWDKISEICEEHDLDGLFSLEFYDTDTNIDYSTNRVTIDGPLGLEIPALEHHATVQTTIKTGWRIYDNNGRNLIDEFVAAETVTTSGKGVNPVEAINAITGRTEAVQTISGNIGRSYAQSILPYWTRVRRDYYVRGSDNFKVAKRRAQTGNWDGAAELWYAETGNSRAKIAGRAHYNMGIINEIEGDLDEAIEWVRIAYEDYGDKRALRYLRTLQDRRARMERLRRQQQ